MKNIITFFACLILIGTVQLNAQDYFKLFYGQQDEPVGSLPFALKSDVKNLDDFIGRYNGQHNAYGKPIDQTNADYIMIQSSKTSWQTWRQKVIGSLFKKTFSDDNEQQILQVAEKMASGPELHFDSTQQWHAEIPLYKSQQDSKSTSAFTLLLRIEKLSGDRYQWIIDSVKVTTAYKGSELKVIPMHDPEKALSPNIHDNGFIKLSQLLKSPSNLAYYIKRSNPDIDLLAGWLKQHPTFFVGPPVFYFYPNSSLRFVCNESYQIVQF